MTHAVIDFNSLSLKHSYVWSEPVRAVAGVVLVSPSVLAGDTKFIS